MAKSLRSKQKRQHRTAKRENYASVGDARQAKVMDKLKKDLEGQPLNYFERKALAEKEAAEGGTAAMADDAAEAGKSDTASRGSRSGRRATRMDTGDDNDDRPAKRSSKLQPRRAIGKKRGTANKRGISAVREGSKISRMGRKPGRQQGRGRKTK